MTKTTLEKLMDRISEVAQSDDVDVAWKSFLRIYNLEEAMFDAIFDSIEKNSEEEVKQKLLQVAGKWCTEALSKGISLKEIECEVENQMK